MKRIKVMFPNHQPAAVSHTTKHRMKVPRISAIKIFPTSKPSAMMLVPKVMPLISLAQGNMTQSRPAPAILPSSCANKLVKP